MKQDCHIKFFTDSSGNPAGGHATGTGFTIDFQHGTVKDGRPNGIFVETLIEIAVARLEYFQRSRFQCRENARAITKLEEALHWLGHRTRDRERRGVENTHEE